MVKLTLMAFILVTFNVHAACPSNLNGKWSGTVVKTKSTIATKQDGSIQQLQPETSYGTFTAIIKGETLITTYYVESEAGQFGGIIEFTDASTSPLTYDKSTCRGTIKTSENTIYFTVSDSGKTINGVSHLRQDGKIIGGDFNSTQTENYVINKQ